MGCFYQTHLFESLKKHGTQNHTFEIIHVVDKNSFSTKRELVVELQKLEINYVKKYNSFYKDNTEKGLNGTRGGGAGIGRPTNEERKKVKHEFNNQNEPSEIILNEGLFIDNVKRICDMFNIPFDSGLNEYNFKAKLINSIDKQINTLITLKRIIADTKN
jgi:hypothetical protein